MRVDARTCRERALECAIRALTDRDPQRKRLFTRLFHTWTSMAVESERADVALVISDRLPPLPAPAKLPTSSCDGRIPTNRDWRGDRGVRRRVGGPRYPQVGLAADE
jgi:hypothetical protein